MQIPERTFFLFLKKLKSSSSGMRFEEEAFKTKFELWQKGQRKLQPLVKTVAATCPG